MLDKLRRFMYGRYGMDKLGIALVIASMVFTFTSSISGIWWLQLPSYLLLILALFRMFSKKTQARYRENTLFLKFWNPVEKWFRLQGNRVRDMKTHRYFSCPSCGNTLRVPKGRGEITITCPVCKTRFDKRT